MTDVTQTLPFPLGGLNVVTEYGLQPERTAGAGRNVRSFDPTLDRNRGGSRPGLVKFLADPVSNGPVQELAVIVYQNADALLTTYDQLFGYLRTTRIADPSTNNRRDFPTGGGPLLTIRDVARVPPGGGNGPGGQERDVRNPPRDVPEGGSGIQPQRRKGTPPRAVNDSLLTMVAAAASDVAVLSNDAYYGTPTVVILSGPTLAGASATVVGNQVRYTPPSSGDGGSDTVVYKLTATGSQGSSTATVLITVAPMGGFRLMQRCYIRDDVSYPDPDEFSVRCVTECNNPARPNYHVNFPGQEMTPPDIVTGGTLPSVAQMNEMIEAAFPSTSFPTPVYTAIDGGDTDTGPC